MTCVASAVSELSISAMEVIQQPGHTITLVEPILGES